MVIYKSAFCSSEFPSPFSRPCLQENISILGARTSVQRELEIAQEKSVLGSHTAHDKL